METLEIDKSHEQICKCLLQTLWFSLISHGHWLSLYHVILKTQSILKLLLSIKKNAAKIRVEVVPQLDRIELLKMVKPNFQ